MSFPTVIAWSWGEMKYHQAAHQLEDQCKEFGYPHKIRIGAPLGEHWLKCPSPGWEERFWVYRYIPGFILEMLEKIDNDLLYMHADLRFTERIDADRFDGMDIGLESGWSQYPPRPDDRVIAAPIFVRNNDRARRFIRLYYHRCMCLDDNHAEHKQLIELWQLFSERDRTLKIKIFDPPLASIRADSDTPIVGTK